jgi:predicted nucleic acid-binding protein
VFLIDTNVVSEIRRPKADSAVQTWVESQPRELQFLSVISMTEIAFGASRHPDPLQRQTLQQWMKSDLEIWFKDRVIALSSEIAESAGLMMGLRQRAGQQLALADALLAATTMARGYVLVTRNTKDFVDLPLAVYNPWTDQLTSGTQHS